MSRPGSPPIAVHSDAPSAFAPAVITLMAAAPCVLKLVHIPANLALTDIVPDLRLANHVAVLAAIVRIFSGMDFNIPKKPLHAPLNVHVLAASPVSAIACLYISGVMLFVMSIRSSSALVSALAAAKARRSSMVICFLVCSMRSS